MTVEERPLPFEGNVQEWEAEMATIAAYKGSTGYLSHLKHEDKIRENRDRLARQRLNRMIETEAAWQEARRDQIRAENEAAAKAAAAASCPTCFCIHAGEC